MQLWHAFLYGTYTINQCSSSANGQELLHRQEPMDSLWVSQNDITSTLPIGRCNRGFNTDQLNFHAYVIRFSSCADKPAADSMESSYASFEVLKFDNQHCIHHIWWLISQTTAIATSNIIFQSNSCPRLQAQFDCSKTFGDQCDISSTALDDHVCVWAGLPWGHRRSLGILTVEHFSTCWPQMQPPYLTGNIHFQ